MKNLQKIILSVTVLSFLLVSCGKYEDGPSLSLLTKKARIANEWQGYSEIDSTGVEQIVDTSQMNVLLTLEKDGTGITSISLGTMSLEIDTEWKLSDDKENLCIRTKYIGSEEWDEWSEAVIIMLESDEMHLMDLEDKSINVYKTKE